MSDTAPSETLEADWEPIQALMLGRIADHLRDLGYSYVRVLSDHLGWGYATAFEPHCTDPHYLFADGFVIRVSLPRVYCFALEPGRNGLLPAFTSPGQAAVSCDLTDIPAREFFYELMTYQRGRLDIYTMPPDCRARLCVQNALLRRRSLYRAAKREAKILRFIRSGGLRARARGPLRVRPTFTP